MACLKIYFVLLLAVIIGVAVAKPGYLYGGYGGFYPYSYGYGKFPIYGGYHGGFGHGYGHGYGHGFGYGYPFYGGYGGHFGHY